MKCLLKYIQYTLVKIIKKIYNEKRQIVRNVLEKYGDLKGGVNPMLRIAFTNDTLREAVKLWLENRQQAIQMHGHISGWNVFNVTDMDSIFANALAFNL